MNSRMDKFYNIMTRTIMFISSYFPLYIMIIILYFSKITKAFLEKKYINNSLCYINAYLNIYFSYKRDFIETRKRKSRKRY